MLVKIIKPLVLAVALLLGMSPAVHANDIAMQELLKVLKDKGNISESEYRELMNSVKANEEKVSEKETAQDEMVKKTPAFSLDKGKLELESANGDHKFRIGGRLQWDVTSVARDGDYIGVSETQFRRARLYLSGTTYKYFDFKFQFDFEDTQDNDQAIEDAYIRYTGWPVKVTLGQRKAPYSMSSLTSSKYIAFIERSFVSDFFNSESIGVGNRAPGITFTYAPKNVNLAGGKLLTEAGYYLLRTPAGGARNINHGHGFSGRLIWANYDKKTRRLLHAGISGGYRTYPNGSVSSIRVRPNVSTGDRIIDSNAPISALSYSTLNLNIAAMYQRFWANMEYFTGSFDLTNIAAKDNNAEGIYFQSGVFLTDDSRRYKKGVWDSVQPKFPVHKGGIGAWEIAFRYDSLSISDGLHTGSGDEQGSAFNVALNWYPINNLRMQINYVSALCDNNQCDWETGDPNFFVLRTQIFF